jgi:hypothetical protein
MRIAWYFRVLSLAFLKSYTWNLSLRIRIFCCGGRRKYINKHISKKDIVEVAGYNQKYFKACVFSVVNGKWCDLPCIFCEKFRRK